MVAVIDPKAVTVTGLNGGNLEVLAQQKHLFFPEGIDLGGTITARPNTTRTALVNRAGRKFSHIMAKGALTPLP